MLAEILFAPSALLGFFDLTGLFDFGVWGAFKHLVTKLHIGRKHYLL